ncbi:hypothetical protein [Chryseobacterium kwangjuense]|uniref:C1q domain-containing protein n=1 Tax=Chryseobacterium kwangjuense TaxID=267125 RepID=A0A135WF27_9FLAO|nr:hypothetical protein [Chryseobacterium kwangjuense]KXH83507.1 hypothetical protein AU378_14030 [Chryseobacterium kwangjuense]
MKNILLLGGILLSVAAFSQVGINTNSPNTTLDVSKKMNGASLDLTHTHGLQAPRLTRAELTNVTASYGTNQNGALIYITDVSGGNATNTSQRQYITEPGYYYFDSNANRWMPLKTTDTNSNIYSADGTLPENRTVTINDHSLRFLAFSVNAFSVDGSTFSVDAANNRVGIGTTSPSNPLHVQGTNPLRLTGTLNGPSNTDDPKHLVIDQNGVVKIADRNFVSAVYVTGSMTIDDNTVNHPAGSLGTNVVRFDHLGEWVNGSSPSAPGSKVIKVKNAGLYNVSVRVSGAQGSGSAHGGDGYTIAYSYGSNNTTLSTQTRFGYLKVNNMDLRGTLGNQSPLSNNSFETTLMKLNAGDEIFFLFAANGSDPGVNLRFEISCVRLY